MPLPRTVSRLAALLLPAGPVGAFAQPPAGGGGRRPNDMRARQRLQELGADAAVRKDPR